MLFVDLARHNRGIVFQHSHANGEIETLADQIHQSWTQIKIKLNFGNAFLEQVVISIVGAIIVLIIARIII